MTQFYLLEHPRYGDDFEFERVNPLWGTARCYFPLLLCPVCGKVGANATLRIELPHDRVREELKQTPVIPLSEWATEVSAWAKRFGVAASRIKPGAEIGPPCAVLNGMPSKDFVYVAGDFWVRSHVRNRLLELGCTGVEFAKAEMIYRGADAEPMEFCDGCQPNYDPIDLERVPEYWELAATGEAWREGQDESTIRVCKLCGQVKYRQFDEIKIDESRWDGSDFFTIEGRRFMIYVTDRVRVALEEIGATNYVCTPLP